MITDTFTLKRDTAAENAAVEGIISLFTDKWDETSKKSSREITALVLMQMKDACIVAPKGSEENEESLMLKHSSQYFEKTIKQLQSSEPLKMVISGSALDEIINNLKNIKTAAIGEEYEKDIKSRIDFFSRKLNQQIEQIQVANQSRKRKAIIYSVIAGFAVTALIYLVTGTTEFSAFFFFITLICGMSAYGVFSRILP